jgi:signal peptide peptidase SppA
MSFRILSAILRQNWAIDERFALSHGWLVSNILNGFELSESKSSNQLQPYKIDKPSASGKMDTVAIIPVHGVLMKYDQEGLCAWAAGTLTIANWVKEAAQDPSVKAIILDIDSPGGTVDGTKLLADTISNVAKPVVAYSHGLIASAAYWIASEADHIIVANETVEVGSIGVQTSFADMRPMWEKAGVKFHVIRASQSKDKNEDFLQALDGNYEPIISGSLDPIASMFIDAVKTNRSDKLTDVDQISTGLVFFANQALKLGLIDSIDSLEKAVDLAISLSDTLSHTHKSSITMENYPLIRQASGHDFELSDDGIFLNSELAAAVENSLSENASKIEALETSAANLQEELSNQALQAQQATSELATANATIESLNQQIAELSKTASAIGGGAGTQTDPFASSQEIPVDDEAEKIFKTRQRATGSNQ